MATDLSTDIAQQAVEPVSSSGDGHSSSGRGIGELIKAQQFLDARVNRKRRRLGIVTRVITTPGCLDLEGRASPPFNGGVT